MTCYKIVDEDVVRYVNVEEFPYCCGFQILCGFNSCRETHPYETTSAKFPRLLLEHWSGSGFVIADRLVGALYSWIDSMDWEKHGLVWIPAKEHFYNPNSNNAIGISLLIKESCV